MAALARKTPAVPLTDIQIAKSIVLVEEDPYLRPIIVNLLHCDGVDVFSTGDPVEAVALCRAARSEVLVLASSSLAASLPNLIADLMSLKPPPRILLTCCRPPSCPLNPAVDCLNIGCLEKPLDFRTERLRQRVSDAFGSTARGRIERQ